MMSPWGEIQHREKIGEGGIFFASTASHGGMYVPPELHKTMPKPYQETFAGGTWYEEDCDVLKVILSFPCLFTPEQVAGAANGAKRWFPEAYYAVNPEEVKV